MLHAILISTRSISALYKLRLLTTIIALMWLSACATYPQQQPADSAQADIRSYAHQLSQQLMNSGTYVRGGERVMITTPAWLEGDLTQADLLALQLQEGLMAELHRAHLHVLEFKMTDGIRVTPTGDFPLSRNYLELRELQRADYVLAATAVNRHDGVIINARLIEFRTQIVAATAEVTIPRSLVEQLRHEQGIELVAR